MANGEWGGGGRGVVDVTLYFKKKYRNKFRPEVSKKFKGLKLLVTVTVNLRI